MTLPLKRRQVPHNPALRDLVREKKYWSRSLSGSAERGGFRGWHERGYLPHRDEPGLIQFVTLRLADTFPEACRSEWEHLRKIENDREKQKLLEEYLDRGRGECLLRNPAAAKIVEDNLRSYEGKRYQLRAWVLMPNHVHILFEVGDAPMSKIIGSWKKHTARLIHRMLNRSGTLWAPDFFDTYMRSAEQERRAITYIEENPAKARLVQDPKNWLWSSARFRDQFGKLAS
jgi:REP element-mobilizing transposase RayT